MEDAIRHLLAAQAWEEAAALIEIHAPTVFGRGEAARLLRWLERLPQPVLQDHPLLVMTYARICRLDQISTDSPRGSNDVMAMDEGQLTDYLAGLEQDLPDEGKTVESQPTYQYIWNAIDLMLRSLSARAVGDWQNAEQALEEVMALGATYGHSHLTFQAAGILAIQHVRQGRLRQGEQIINQLAQQAQSPIAQLPSGPIIAQGMICYEHNQLDEAHGLVTSILARIGGQNKGEVSLRLRWLLARILSASGKHEAAEELMAAVINERSQKQNSWLASADLAADQAYTWLLHDKLAPAEEWLTSTGLRLDGELTYQNGHSQLVHARILIAQKKFVDAEKLLANLCAAFPEGLSTEPFMKLLLSHAIALYGQGKVNQAVATLWQGLRLAAGEGYVRPFLELGSDMYTLLSLVGRQEQVSQEIKRNIVLLLFEFGQSGIDIPIVTPSDSGDLVTAASITAREQELLRLVAQGLSNREISSRLVITVNTVKSHLRRIYLKLGVQNRAQAVMRAQELHLL